MSRVLFAVGLVLVVLIALAAGAGWLAYGPDATRSGEIEVAGLAAPVAVAWPDSGGVAVEAASWADAAVGIGYAHAADHAFAMALWRQTARGETAAWFGDSVRAVDLHARSLGLDALARQTYDGLDAPTRAALDGYARGVNAALAEPGVAQADAFVWLGITPEPWQPHDALAVERLVAYLGTSALATDSVWTQAARQSRAVARFVRSDSAFRASLGAGGLQYARAFAVQAGGATAFVAHQPAGTSPLTLVVPVAVRVGGRGVAVASVPGTLSLPAGTDGASAWSVFLTSTLRLEPFSGALPMRVYSRVVDRDGDETLVAVARDSSGLILGTPAPVARRDSAATAPDSAIAATTVARPPPVRLPARGRPVARPVARPVLTEDSVRAAPPSAWRVRWSGFQLGTDAGAFAALADGRTPGRFMLLDGAGLLATGGRVRPLGRPTVVASGAGFSFAAADESARSVPDRLDSLTQRARQRGTPLTARSLALDAHSPWAARRLPPMLRALGPRDSVDRALETVNAYLRSWDGAYTADAIAPTIFEAWLGAHRAFTGHLPDPADSSDAALLPFTLRIARAELRDAYGPDEAQWRWGQIRGGVRTPVLGRLAGAPGRRYTDAPAGPGGHPTALRPGPAQATDDAFADATGADAGASGIRADSSRAASPGRAGPGPSRPAGRAGPGPAVWSTWTTLGTGRLFVRGPRPSGASISPVEAAFGDPGVSVGIDSRAALPARRLVLTPAR